MAVGSTTANVMGSTNQAVTDQNKLLKQQNAQNQQAWQSQQPMIDDNNQYLSKQRVETPYRQ